MPRSNGLGEFLRARRAQIAPAEVGLPPGGVRRVPGLRREELALLVGLSVDYYARLEQGRERHPSDGVLTALARVLRLGPDAQRHLFALANPGPAVAQGPAPGGRVPPSLRRLLDDWSYHPAVVFSRGYSVVAANQLGAALYAGHEHSDNVARLLFLDESSRTFFRDWATVAASTVAGLRASATQNPHDPDLLALVGELTVRSREFATRWSRAEVREKTSGPVLLHHPLVGDLDLTYESLRPTGSPDLMLKVYRAEPGSPAAEALAMLGSLTAVPETPEPASRRVP